jgi:anaerobic dimethyl sulfoxide reductase subunit B (iron-sulfur subunit)
VGAIEKQADTGIVTVDDEKCIGCHYCFFACPFGAPQYGDDGKMQKCELCIDRLAEGQQPKCVTTCPAEALHFGTMEELGQMAQARAAQRLAASTRPAMIISK